MTVRKLAMPCGGCNAPVEVDIAEGQRIVNMETVSIIVIEHQGNLNCPNCNAVVMPTVKNVAGVLMQAMPVPPEQQNKIIVPANGRIG